MAERRGPWCRPFLTLPKRDLLAYLGYRGLAWSTDSTNTADAFLRNRLRHLVLPQLSAALPGWEGGLLATAQKAKAENKALEALVEERGFRPAGQDCFEADAGLLKESEAVRERAFLCAASALLGAGRLSSALAAAAFAALGGGKKRYRGGGLLLEAIGDRLRMTRELDFPRRGGYFVRVGDAASLPLRLEFRDISIRAFWTRAPGAKGAREGAFSFPLIVRSRRPGDALPIRGGRKPLDELFSEWRLPLPLRDLVPVLEDRTGILGVLGEAFGAKDRWRPCAIEASDRFLRVKVKGA
jgi:tRNA(Ile)-lysidine synthase